jgi:hypothetical protein
MITDYTFCSRKAFEDHVGTPSEIFISISGEENDYKRPTVLGNWNKGLFLAFDDIDIQKPELTFMSDFHAESIVNFLLKYHQSHKEYRLVVHCYAGISRSAAVVKFFEDVFMSYDARRFSRYEVYNKSVYRKLINEFQSQEVMTMTQTSGTPPFWMPEEDYIIYYGGVEALKKYTAGPVSWLNYRMCGTVFDHTVQERADSGYLNSFLVQAIHTPTYEDDDGIDWYICPFEQTDNTYWAQCILTKMESNLELYVVCVFGCDDASYSKHYLSVEEANADLEEIKRSGISSIYKMKFFFTN